MFASGATDLPRGILARALALSNPANFDNERFWVKVLDWSERIHALAGSAGRSGRSQAVGWIPPRVFRVLAALGAPHGLQRCASWKRGWNVIGFRQIQCNILCKCDYHFGQRCEYPMECEAAGDVDCACGIGSQPRARESRRP